LPAEEAERQEVQVKVQYVEIGDTLPHRFQEQGMQCFSVTY
jgi:hypothetical protein